MNQVDPTSIVCPFCKNTMLREIQILGNQLRPAENPKHICFGCKRILTKEDLNKHLPD